MLTPLPIDPLLPDITRLIRDENQIILTATPGAGKTTRLPAELLKSVPGKIAVLEPRRMAAIGACQHIAEERGWTVGKDVGYQVRFESKSQKDTRLIFMTDALFLRRFLSDPELKEFDLIVLDEFHERNLNQDVILGLLKELQELGRNIKIMIMSATLDIESLKKFLPQSHHIDVPGKVFPLEIRYQKTPQKLKTDPEFFKRIHDAVLVSSQETRGDILVFLPGQGEILKLKDLLDVSLKTHDIFPLHGSLSLNDQKKILQPHNRPRVILATNIAEASVTVPGVDRVIDSGLSKVLETNLQSGFSRLELVRISQFNARQRAGRAARQKEGVCVRLWTTHEDVSQSQALAPECQRVDLASTLLMLAQTGISDFKKFSWLDEPPHALLQIAQRFLKSSHAIDSENRITAHGKKLLNFPLPPRLAQILVHAEVMGEKSIASRMTSILNERDFLKRMPLSDSHLECDITYRLEILNDFSQGKNVSHINPRAAENVLDSARQLENLMKPLQTTLLPDDYVKRLLLLTQSDRLCRRRKDSERGVMVGGRGVSLSPDSQVKKSEFFLSLEGIDFLGRSDTTVSIATGFDKDFVLKVLSQDIKTLEEVIFDDEKGRFYLKRVRAFQDLELDDPTLLPVESSELGDRFVEVVEKKWDYFSEKNEALKKWLARWNFFVSQDSSLRAHFTDTHIKQVCQMVSFNKTQIHQVLEADWVNFIESVIDKKILHTFHKEVPSHFKAPSGFSHQIHYDEGEMPFVEIRLQEVFGLTQTPQLLFNKVPLTFKLLGPNFRPVQVTSDIAGFWQRTYQEVRKELKSRYPKHSWPDDPLTAPAVAKGSRRY